MNKITGLVVGVNNSEILRINNQGKLLCQTDDGRSVEVHLSPKHMEDINKITREKVSGFEYTFRSAAPDRVYAVLRILAAELAERDESLHSPQGG